MSEENVELVRRWMELWNDREFAGMLALMDPNIEVEVAMGAPMDGLYHGHEGLIRTIGEFWSKFTTYESEMTECIPAGDDVLFAVTHRATGAASGAQVEMSHWQVATVRDGKIVRLGNFMTREQAFEAAGLSE